MKWYESILIIAAVIGLYRLVTSKTDSAEHDARESALALGHNDSLLAAFEQATKENPNDVMAHLSLAVTLRSMGRYADAIKPLDRVVGIDPSNAEAHHLLGRTLARLAEANPDDANKYREDAIVSLENALALEPSWTQLRDEIAHIKELAGRRTSTVDA